MANDTYLIIPDLQIPFEAEKALSFCAYIKRHYKIPDENILNVGDEVDQLHGGMYPKDPNGHHTPNSEIKAAREKIKEWASVFPLMKIAISNHGLRWIKKASLAEIPSQMMRSYQEVLEMPDGWKWAYKWIIETGGNRFGIKHGMDLGGKTPYRTCAELSAISWAFGHLHSSPGICHLTTLDKMVWAFNVGCLIDLDAYAFRYEENSKFKPGRGAGLVCNKGRMPIYIPYE